GEAFDYLIGEKTRSFAMKAIGASASLLLQAKHPVISVNGNAAALCPKGLVELAEAVPARLEVNIFHPSMEREKKIRMFLEKHGAKEVLMPQAPLVKHIESNRRLCNEEGIAKADVVLVPLEDGDRCEALRKMGKKVITIDLNPMSRTAEKASITIVDNITRAVPLLVKAVRRIKENRPSTGQKAGKDGYNNKEILKEALNYISKRFS
ncbi:phosphopantothenate/pantothenate synthetase, partial [Candidatus Woesearchaeota archaeon]|nr:phosphopantothenate/pantothenate synthetase [Candidatus Woesearchaeota archaeon]